MRPIVLALAATATTACAEIPVDTDPAQGVEFAADGCPLVDRPPGISSASGRPGTGAWRATWRCVSDCTSPRPLETTSDTVEVTASAIRFKRGASVLSESPIDVTASVNCWVARPTAVPCRTGVLVCSSTRAQSSGAEIPLIGWDNGQGGWLMFEALLTR